MLLGMRYKTTGAPSVRCIRLQREVRSIKNWSWLQLLVKVVIGDVVVLRVVGVGVLLVVLKSLKIPVGLLILNRMLIYVAMLAHSLVLFCHHPYAKSTCLLLLGGFIEFFQIGQIFQSILRIFLIVQFHICCRIQ